MKRIFSLSVILISLTVHCFSQSKPDLKVWVTPKSKKAAVKVANKAIPVKLNSKDTVALKALITNSNLLEDSVFVEVYYGKPRIKLLDSSFVLSSANSIVKYSTVSKYYTIELGDILFRENLSLRLSAYDRYRKLLYKSKTW